MITNTFSEKVPGLPKSHFQHLHEERGISMEVIRKRGYNSLLEKAQLKDLVFSKAQQRVPGILMPIYMVDCQLVGHVYRPDNPRINTNGKVIKYENLPGSSLRIDCPPRCGHLLGDPSVPLWVTEGVRVD